MSRLCLTFTATSKELKFAPNEPSKSVRGLVGEVEVGEDGEGTGGNIKGVTEPVPLRRR